MSTPLFCTDFMIDGFRSCTVQRQPTHLGKFTNVTWVLLGNSILCTQSSPLTLIKWSRNLVFCSGKINNRIRFDIYFKVYKGVGRFTLKEIY